MVLNTDILNVVLKKMNGKIPCGEIKKISPKPILGQLTYGKKFMRVLDFIIDHITSGNCELEVKLGTLVDKRNKRRLKWPIETDCIISDSGFHSFNSNIDLSTFTKLKGNLTKVTDHHKKPVKYTQEVDQYYFVLFNNKKQSVRLTTNTTTGDVPTCIIKERKGNIDMYAPHSDWDFRISASEERKVPQTIIGEDNIILTERHKDRYSYLFNIWQVDLTKVETFKERSENGDLIIDSYSATITYEAEIECVCIDTILHHVALHRQGKPNRMINIVHMMLQNVNSLINSLK